MTDTEPWERIRGFSRLIFGVQRPGLGLVLAVALPVTIELVATAAGFRTFTTVLLLHLAGAVLVAALGGVWPAVVASLIAMVMLNLFSTQPIGSFHLVDPQDAVTLAIFLVVACSMGIAVGLAGRRAAQAEQARDEASLLNSLALRILGSDDSLESFLRRLSETLDGRPVSLLAVDDDAASPNAPQVERLLASTSAEAPARSAAAGAAVAVGDQYRLLVGGSELDARQQHLLGAFVALVVAVRERQELVISQRENARLNEGNVMRTAILQAVSHDLRTPIAGVKLNVATLRLPGVTFTPEEQAELLATIEEYTDRLSSLVANLLDMSRLTGESAAPLLGPVRWTDVMDRALHHVPAELVTVEVAGHPPVLADAGMLERVVANIAENAVRHGRGSRIRIMVRNSATLRNRPAAELLVEDHGPGMDLAHQEELFQPFQSMDDSTQDGVRGVGLGLAVARGFTQVMGGRLRAEATAGGGVTMVVTLPLAEGHDTEAER
ncbi:MULTISPECIES: ATP-binding protein [Arthrobacter]|uniref:histidine kinase n=2 Tax=Arthrobacter TaxID=1663 RepID=A0ABU9KMJ6_9MICC|nr:ATP-binding protein [Arthrobacter sp. YJM1]MDP5227949.1 ATP-binding protein [Arthrobacter sp. YJM1]